MSNQKICFFENFRSPTTSRRPDSPQGIPRVPVVVEIPLGGSRGNAKYPTDDLESHFRRENDTPGHILGHFRPFGDFSGPTKIFNFFRKFSPSDHLPAPGVPWGGPFLDQFWSGFGTNFSTSGSHNSLHRFYGIF